MKVIHGIEGYSNKDSIAPCKIKQPNLEVLKYIKGGKYPKSEVGENVYAVREGNFREGIQYVGIKFSVYHEMTWDD